MKQRFYLIIVTDANKKYKGLVQIKSANMEEMLYTITRLYDENDYILEIVDCGYEEPIMLYPKNENWMNDLKELGEK